MSTVEEIEQAIRKLPPSDQIVLRDWLAAFEGEFSEEQMESVLVGLEQARNGERIESPPNFEADMQQAHVTLEKSRSNQPEF